MVGDCWGTDFSKHTGIEVAYRKPMKTSRLRWDVCPLFALAACSISVIAREGLVPMGK